MEILQVKDLEFTYPEGDRKAIDKISFTVKAGEFVVICGETGCGKTTLLRMFKKELAPAGTRAGTVFYNGKALEELKDAAAASEIGFVMQKPENQIVTDKVWHELAFGLENMGFPTSVIRRRISEMSSYFGIGEWFHKDIAELSGGQKQLLNLASVMVMQPRVLILDEPTAQMDPIISTDFIATLHKLNRELSITILLAEHRLEEVLPVADTLILMDKGKILYQDVPRKAAGRLENGGRMLYAMPGAVRLYHGLGLNASCPLTVKEGRSFIEANFTNEVRTLKTAIPKDSGRKKETVLQLKEVWFRYHRDTPDILKGASLTVYRNEILCILGGNASGKSTMLGVIAGILKAYGGAITLFDKKLQSYKYGSLYRNNLALLPQDVTTVFTGNTVEEDGKELGNLQESLHLPYDLSGLLHRHPYDLSGGEQQLCALAKVLLQKPRLLLLDEPTKGIDAYAKQDIIRILKDLKKSGMTIILVTHDVEFAAACADRCALLFDGDIISVDTPELFFAENNFYTTAANRMTRYIYDNIVTIEEAIEICRRNDRKADSVLEAEGNEA